MSPPALDRVVKTCLAKDPEERWQSAHDVASQLKWLAESSLSGMAAPPIAARRKASARLAWTTAAILGAAAVAAILGYVRRAPVPPRAIRFEIFPPEKVSFNSIDTTAAVSPDGRQIVYGQNDPSGRVSLWVRSLDSLEARHLDGTLGAYDPFWSPDGRFIAFGNSDTQRLQKIEASGGPVQTICEMDEGRGGSWNRDNVIVFSTKGGSSPILRVSAGGGAPVAVTALDASRGEIGHWQPEFLPDGKHFLVLIRSTRAQNGVLAVGSLDSKEVKRLPAITVSASWAPPGVLLFVRDGSLMAQRFDARRLELVGEPFLVANAVEYSPTYGAGSFTVSSNGALVYQKGGEPFRRLAWLDRKGRELGALGEAGQLWGNPRISPDGRFVATQILDPLAHNTDIWLFDVARGVRSRVTSEQWLEADPVWSPDSKRVAYDSNREGLGDLHVRPASGVGDDEILLRSDRWKVPTDWSPDGRTLLFTVTDAKTKSDIWMLPLGGDRKPLALVATPFDESDAHFSPDGRFFIYATDESGKSELYVQPFPPNGSRWQVSVDGGMSPRWRRDGIYYREGQRRKFVPVKAGSAFEAGAPVDLFATPENFGHDITADGQRFLFNLPASEARGSPITVVLNWAADVKELKQ